MRSRALALLLLTCSLAITFTTGCGKRPQRQRGPFEKYIADFESQARAYGRPISILDIDIHFGSLEAEEFGRCTLTTGKTPQIILNEKRWLTELNDERREALLFHELSHCELFQQHRNDMIKNENRPASLMNKYLLEADVYKVHKEEYLKELFNANST